MQGRGSPYKPPLKWQTLPTCHCEEQSDVAISPTRSGQCRGADSRARRRTCNLYKPPSKWQTPPTCHCEERSDVAISQYYVGYHESSGENVTAFPRLHPKGTSSRFALRAPRRFAPRNDNLGECRGAPAPLHGLIPLYKALTARKGHAASVKRQSRQRLRSDRRYRRNRLVRFYRHLARTGSAFPRLPRRFAPRNDTSGSAAVHQCPPAVEWLCTRRSLTAATVQ